MTFLKGELWNLMVDKQRYANVCHIYHRFLGKTITASQHNLLSQFEWGCCLFQIENLIPAECLSDSPEKLWNNFFIIMHCLCIHQTQQQEHWHRYRTIHFLKQQDFFMQLYVTNMLSISAVKHKKYLFN